ncbi:hypothetical protein K3495_g7828 [Podosphaera aphanis]|nr:hypothetical protein K3495_g7828 [Podosphaera aphanis]
MWKRLNRSKQTQISEPFRSIVNAGSDSYSTVISDKQLLLEQGHQTPRELSCPPHECFRISESNCPIPGYRDSRLKPVSPSSVPQSFVKIAQIPRKSLSYKDGEVSPPSSSDTGILQMRQSPSYHYDEEVSPIEEILVTASSYLKGCSQTMELFPESPRRRNATPEETYILTTANIKSKRDAPGSAEKRQAIDPRWDPYSGEITSSERGKPQSVKPRLFGTALRSGHEKTDLKSNAAVQTTLSERIRKLTSHTSTIKQEKTNGIQTNRKQLSVNTKSADSSRFIVKRPNEVTSSSPAPTPALATTPIPAPLDSPGISFTTTPDHDRTGESSPVLDQIEPTESITSMLERHNDSSSPILSQNKLRNDSPNEILAVAPTHSLEDKILSQKDNQKSLLPEESRVFKNSMPVEEPQSLYINHQYQQALSPGLDRIIRKPSPSETRVFVRSALDSSEQISTTKIRAKTTQTENYSNDRVITLQTRLDDLAYRRRKIARHICQLREIMPRDTLFISDELLLRRRDEKRQIEMLLAEEADIKREEHEASLQLHRAWKRKDFNANFEPTCLWVRRVTT